MSGQQECKLAMCRAQFVCQISSQTDENALNRWKKSVNIHYRLNTQLYTFGP